MDGIFHPDNQGDSEEEMNQATTLDAKELERRVRDYLPKLSHKLTKARFINASLALGRCGTIHGLDKLGHMVGIGSERSPPGRHGATCRRLAQQLIEAKIVASELGREDIFVESLGCTLPNHRYVIHLHEDLLM